MGFFTIFVAEGLSQRDYRRALSSGPTFVSSRGRDHRELLTSAKFRQIEEVDLTDEFLTTAKAWYEGRQTHEEELVAAEGGAAFEERQSDSRTQLEAIQSGLLRRSLFVCS